jgi:phospholipase/carboxylesterase
MLQRALKFTRNVPVRHYTKSIYNELECDIIEPKFSHTSTVIWNHGLGDTSAGFKDLLKDIIPPTTRCILPNASMRPITINNGYVMRGWYDIKSLDKMGDFEEDREGMLESKALLTRLIDHEVDENNPKKIILGGFSQGAAISLLTGLTYEKQTLQAIISASGYTLLRKEMTIHEKQAHVPVHCYHGKVDDVVPCQYALMCYEELKKKGVNVILQVGNFGHWVTDEEIADWAKIMRQ